MAILYYWKEYADNTAHGPVFKLNQKNQVLSEVRPGETVWTWGLVGPGRYALYAKFIAERAGLNDPKDPAYEQYGAFFVQADEASSQFFDVASQESIEPLIRSLSIKANAGVLGQAFQGKAGVRRLSVEDDRKLEEHAFHLTLSSEMNGHYRLPEARSHKPLETSEGDGGLSPPDLDRLPPARREQVLEVFARNRRHVRELKEKYEGKCQICGSVPFEGKLGDISEAHHIHWLSRGGSDILDNLVLLCPNHHSAIHALDPEFDRKELVFRSEVQVLPIRLDRHLRSEE